MKIIIKKGNSNISNLHPNLHSNDSYLDKRIGFWANVKDINPKKNMVSVISDTGILVTGLPIVSSIWVKEYTNYVSGSRNLPPIGSRVFVLMPTGTISGAFVLCSGFSLGDTNTHTLFSHDESENEECINVNKTVTKSGWTIEENVNGEISISNLDKTFQFQITKDEKNNPNIKINKAEKDLFISDNNNNEIKFGQNSILINKNLEVLQ